MPIEGPGKLGGVYAFNVIGFFPASLGKRNCRNKNEVLPFARRLLGCAP